MISKNTAKFINKNKIIKNIPTTATIGIIMKYAKILFPRLNWNPNNKSSNFGKLSLTNLTQYKLTPTENGPVISKLKNPPMPGIAWTNRIIRLNTKKTAMAWSQCPLINNKDSERSALNLIIHLKRFSVKEAKLTIKCNYLINFANL